MASKETLNKSIFVVATYVFCQMLADITSTKIAIVGGLAIDGGTFIYPLTFTIRDLAHKLLGKGKTKKLIWLTAGGNLFMSLFFWLIGKLPPDPSWPYQQAYENILSPLWRIVFASIAAELVSELLDTEIYQWWKNKVTSKYQWSRVLVSNTFAIPVDSLLFGIIAFWGVVPSLTVWQIILANILVKGLVSLLSLPSIYLIKEEN